MGTDTKDYDVRCEPGSAVLKGEFSLSNPTEYETIFDEMKKGIEAAGDHYTINLVKIHFMSSSGITALARVVMHARKCDTRLTILVDDTMLWQRKTMVALQHLWKELNIQSVGTE